MTSKRKSFRSALIMALALSACGGGAPADGGLDAHDGTALADGDTGARNDSAADASVDAPLGPRTASTWLGTNLAGDLIFADVTRYLSPFDTAAAQRDANGYPVAGASGLSSTDVGFQLPTGDYNISFTGDGQVDVSGVGQVSAPWTTVGSEHRNVVHITGTPGEFGHMLQVRITNTSGAPVQNLRILFPGQAYGSTDLFTPQFLNLLVPFRAMRFMDWEATNGSTLANWTDRPRAASFGALPNGVPYEYLAELVNLTGKDAWITIPEHATDDFIRQFATFLRDRFDYARIDAARRSQGISAPFRLYVEYSNETWNGGFTAYHTLATAAGADTSRYSGTYSGTYGPTWMSGNAELMRVGQYEADTLVRIGNIFREVFATNGHRDIVAPVLSGWALGAVYSDVGLVYIRDHYGNPSQFVSAVAIAPYFGPDDTQTSSLPAIFTSMTQNVHSMDAVFQDFRRLVDQYGIEIAAYEGGQSLTGTQDQTLKHLAQHDMRMYSAYLDFFALWRMRFGNATFMHFSLAGTPGIPEFVFQYGYWGSIPSVLEDPVACGRNLAMLAGTESIDSVRHACPKYRALFEQAAN